MMSWLPVLGMPAVSERFELAYLWAYFVFSAVVYFRWAFLVVSAICDYLGIQCLTIPEEKWRANEDEKKQRKGDKLVTSGKGKAG